MTNQIIAKFALPVVIVAAAALPTISFAGTSQVFQPGTVPTLEITSDSDQYNVDYTYATHSGTISPESFQIGGMRDSGSGLSISIAQKVLPKLMKSETSTVRLDKLVIYKNTPGDLPNCDVLNTPLAPSTTINVNVSANGCSIS